MPNPFYVLDPTIDDKDSAIRGIGRYIQTLKESLPDAIFTGTNSKLPNHAVVINPFYSVVFPERHVIHDNVYRIAVIHDLIPLKYPHHFPLGIRQSIVRTLHKHTIHDYQTVVTDSYASKNDIHRILGVPNEKIHIIYPPIAQTLMTGTSLKNTQLPLKKQNYVIYVGDVTWNKNLVTLLQAIENARIPCLFVGKHIENDADDRNPWHKEFSIFKRKAYKSTYAQFTGYISDDKLSALYRNALCNILVSRDEGFGFSYVEAASQGTPSVLADIPVLRETAGDTALFANPHSHEDISHTLATLQNNVKLRNELGVKAQYRSQRFNKHTFSMQWNNLLANISL